VPPQDKSLIAWTFPEHLEAEHGTLYAEGLAQFGICLERLLCIRTPNQTDALWAAEQALKLPGARALCAIAPSQKGLGLTASRRLLLLAEKHQSQCVLIRLDTPAASAAWLRFNVRSAPSEAVGRELGAPAFDVRLTRNRAGPAGQSWRLHWNPHDRALNTRRALDGDLAAALADRPAAAPERRYAI
jgi:protein ImuA